MHDLGAKELNWFMKIQFIEIGDDFGCITRFCQITGLLLLLRMIPVNAIAMSSRMLSHAYASPKVSYKVPDT